MVLKQIRISRQLTQDQLAQMSGLNVRTIQRIESGHRASMESMKCIAAALDVSVEELQQETFAVQRESNNWKQLPFWLKCWFAFNLLSVRPQRKVSVRIEKLSHACGFLFCVLGFVSEAALAGGLILLANAYFFRLLLWQGDNYGIWYETAEPVAS